MKLVILPDLHESILKPLPNIGGILAAADWVLLPGDLTIQGNAAAMHAMLAALKAYNANLLAVPGEWDTRMGSDALSEHGCNLHGQYRLIEGVGFLGLGGCLPYHNAPKEHLVYDNLQYELLLQDNTAGLSRRTPLVLMTHHPPYNTVSDRLYSGKQSGSRAIRDFIDQRHPLLCCTGHLHHVQTIEAVGRTLIINPGPLWLYRSYAYVELEGDQVLAAEIRAI